MKRIVYVVNNPAFLLSHRIDICNEVVKKGHEVHVVAPMTKETASKLESMGMLVHNVALSRKGKNLLSEMGSIASLYKLFKKIKPDLVHLITIKPYLYGGIVARLAGVNSVVSAVAGLGIVFSSKDLKYRVLRALLYPLYKFAFGHRNQKVIFQNRDDRKVLLDWGVLTLDKCELIRGSGVNLDLCPYLPEQEGVPIITFASRLLKDKGVVIFADASRILMQRKVRASFWLIGEPDNGNANTVSQEQLELWENEGLVKLFGFRKDIPQLFAQSNIVTLPSFYGEGLPKVLVEAAACGRAVITTDHPGCRDAINENETGILIPIRDSKALADSIEALINNPVKRKQLGAAGRVLAEKEFSIEFIVKAHIGIYDNLLKSTL